MFIRIDKENVKHTRTSKLGREHEYVRTRSIVVMRCDNCDSKRFAQTKGVEQKKVWDRPVSSLDDISRL